MQHSTAYIIPLNRLEHDNNNGLTDSGAYDILFFMWWVDVIVDWLKVQARYIFISERMRYKMTNIKLLWEIEN